MKTRMLLLPLLLLLTPSAAKAQSLTLPAMTPLAFHGAPALLPQRFAIDPRKFLAQAVVPLSTVEAAQPATPPVTSGLATSPSLWLPVSFGSSKSWTLGVNKTLNGTYADVARDVYNGMWAIGYGIETEQLWHKDSVSGQSREYGYLGLENLFCAGDTAAGGGNGKGIFAAHIGVKLPTVALSGLGWVTDHDLQADLPPWGQYINKIISIEGGVGYRVFGISQSMANQGIKKLTVDVAGQVNLPIATVMSWIGVPGTL